MESFYKKLENLIRKIQKVENKKLINYFPQNKYSLLLEIRTSLKNNISIRFNNFFINVF